MKVKIFKTITVKTVGYLQTDEEEKEHKRQEAEALEKIKSQILSKNVIGILKIKRYREVDKKTTDWATLIITPDADKKESQLQNKMVEFLSKNNYGAGTEYHSGLHITSSGGSILNLKALLDKFE